MDRYDVQYPVGQGAYGLVVRARHRQSGRIVAIKKMGLSRDRLQILRELCALRNLHHENILTLIDSYCSSDTLNMVTDFVPYRLNDVILDPRRPKTDDFIRFFYHQILSGVQYMHSLNIMHRDLKPDNILVTRTGMVRIADFGQASLYYPDEPEREYDNNVATRSYRAPELLFSSRKYDLSVDVWAMGCVLAEFVLGSPLFQGRSDIDQMAKIFSVLGTPTEENWPQYNSMPDAGKVSFDPQRGTPDWNGTVRGASEDLLAFLLLHLRLCGSQRATSMQLLSHPFMLENRVLGPYRILKREQDSLSRRLPLLNRR